MNDRTLFRLKDISDAVLQIELLLTGATYEALQADRVMRAAFERFLEIISEASRHIPRSMTENAPEVPWRRVHDIGNHIRHAYNRVDAEILWRIYADGELARLNDAVAGFIAKMESEGSGI